MQTSITNKLTVIIAALAVAFGAALTVFAYEDLLIKIEIVEIEQSEQVILANVEYEEGGVSIEDTYMLDATNLNDAYQEVADILDISVEEVEDVVVATEDSDEVEDVEEAEEAVGEAEAAIAEASTFVMALDDDNENRAEYVVWLESAGEYLKNAKSALAVGDYTEAEENAERAEKKAQEINHGNDDDRCDDDNPGNSDKMCDDENEEGDKVKDKDQSHDKYEDYGKSTDRDELQSQLRELLLILIQLLQQQMAMEGVATP